MIKKRAQAPAAGAAALLVFIIAVAILLYILFLPPGERAELLDGNLTSNGTSETRSNMTLILESPGTVNYLEEDEIEHSIPSIRLFSQTSANLMMKKESISFKTSWFGTEEARTTFEVDDPANTENIILTFNIREGKGLLNIYLNNKLLYSGLPGDQIKPIVIQNVDITNTLEFKPADVGWKFWQKNYYILENIRIVGDVTDVSKQKSRSTFIVTRTEKDNLKRTFLKFFPECTPGSVGVLDAYINNHNVFSAVPDCGLLTSIQFLPQYLSSGENTVMFRTTQGNYILDTITVKSELKEIVNPIYYFKLEKDEFNDIEDNKLDVNLTMTFVDDIQTKRAKLIINGIEIHLNQEERIYSKLLDPYVVLGNNALEIEPSTTLDIVELEIELQ